jgi:hypothetical protein
VSNINWPEVAAGFVIGSLPLLIRQTFLYLRYARFPGRRRYLGDWHSYWRSTTGLPVIGHEKVRIRYSLLRNRLIVTVTVREIAGTGTYEYEGTISERRGMVRYLYLRDRSSHVEETWVMIDPFYNPIDITVGVQATIDLRGLPVATGQLISRSELDVDDVERRIPKGIINTDPVQYSIDEIQKLHGNTHSTPSGSPDPDQSVNP